LKARIYKKFPISKDGSKIIVRVGGKRNFNPIFDNESYIEFPKRSLLMPWQTNWNRVYFVRNGASKCVNFKTETVFEPDPTLVFEAAENKILKNIGSEKVETPILIYIILVLCVITLLKVFGVFA